jgi:general stress protein 26
VDKKLCKQIVSIIKDVNDMTIATVRDDGFPQATTVSYVNGRLDIYFMTHENKQKPRKIARNQKLFADKKPSAADYLSLSIARVYFPLRARPFN